MNKNPLNDLLAILKPDMDSVNQIIMERMSSEAPLIPELAGYLIASGGKRIRPMLTLASAALFDYQGKRQNKLAACVEFIHTATLLHDDVVDESDQRRGQASANAVYGNEASVLVGDFLFSRSFELMVEDGSLDVLRILSKASAVIAEGEVMQLSMNNDLEADESKYYEVIKSKTSELFCASCEVGGTIADRSKEECQALRDYGTYLGIAFQIADDVLDYNADEAKLGKSIGDDFKEGKMTLPIIKAVKKVNAEERAFLKKCFVNLEQDDGDFDKTVKILQKYGVLEESLKDAEEFVAKGVRALAILPDNEIRKLMEEIIAFVVHREY